MYNFDEIFGQKKRVMVIAAHPDDADVFFGGTMARLTKLGVEVMVVVSINGARGSKINHISEDELTNIRMLEEIDALGKLGVKKEMVRFLGYSDGELENNYETIGKYVQLIREFQPELIMTHEPGYYYNNGSEGKGYINHRDHRKTGECVVDAVYPFCRDVSFFKDQIDMGLKPASPLEIIFTDDNNANCKFDINMVLAEKRAALETHKSQFDKETVEEILNLWKEGEVHQEQGNYLKLSW